MPMCTIILHLIWSISVISSIKKISGGTEVIYSYKQEDPGVYVQPEEILAALGLGESKDAPRAEEASGGGGWS